MERNGPTLTQFDERIGRNGWPGCATWRPRTHDHNRVYEAFSVCRLHPFRPLCVFNCFSGPALRLTRVSSACVRSVWFCRLVAQTRDLPGLLNPGFSRRASWPPGVRVHKGRTGTRSPTNRAHFRATVFTRDAPYKRNDGDKDRLNGLEAGPEIPACPDGARARARDRRSVAGRWGWR